MKRALIVWLAFGLTACGNPTLSDGEAKTFAVNYWRVQGISMRELGLCEGNYRTCLAAIECIQPAALDLPPVRQHPSQMFMTFPAFTAADVRVENLTHRTQEGVPVGATLRERAEFIVRVAPSERVRAYASCPAFAELTATIEQPVRFSTVFIGQQETNGSSVTIEWGMQDPTRQPNH